MNLGIKKAFILAGGLGTRLRPITYEISKLVLPIQGKPTLQWNIELVKRFGVKDITLAVGYKHEQIKEHFGNGKSLGVRLHYNVEKKYMGTAGALKIAEKTFKNQKKFIMMNGDELKDINFKAMNKVHEANNAMATLGLATVPYKKGGGVVKLKGNQITEFSEKPKGEKGGSKLINAGAYILNPKIFKLIPRAKKASIEKETFPKVVKLNKLYGVDMSKRQFLQTDNFERFENAIFNWKGFKKV